MKSQDDIELPLSAQYYFDSFDYMWIKKIPYYRLKVEMRLSRLPIQVPLIRRIQILVCVELLVTQNG